MGWGSVSFHKFDTIQKAAEKKGIFLNVNPGRLPTPVLSREDILLAC